MEAELRMKNNEIEEQKVEIDTFSVITMEVKHLKAQLEQDRQSAKRILQQFGINIQGSVGCYMIIKLIISLTLIGMRQGGFTPLIIFGLDFVS